MTAEKAKAEELYNKIYFRLPNKMSGVSKRLYSKMFSNIMVDEIIKSFSLCDENWRIRILLFWKEVQNEINKL